MSEPRIESVDRLYAQSLYELAETHDAVDQIADQAKTVRHLLREEPQLRHIFESRILSAEQLAGSIERLFSGRAHDAFYRFLLVVNHKRRLPRLGRILTAFAHLYDEKRGIIHVDVYVAQELSDEATGRVRDRIGQALGKQIEVHQHVDDGLIGGIKVKVGDKLIDGSVAKQLQIIESRLQEAGREKAKAQTA